ncbi:MAG: SIMPL domain-containing protein, partial [Gemmatimonadaceae bacterium]
MKQPLAIVVLSALMSHVALAQAPTAPRTVTVIGESEIKVVPDRVVLTLGVASSNKDLTELKKQNDRRMQSVLAAIAASGVAPNDVQTDYLNLEPEFDTQSPARRILIAYVQRTTLVVTLRDVAKFDRLLTAALQAGVEYIQGVDFQTTQLRKYRDDARALAVRAAKEKAVALATELGQSVGTPQSIQEGYNGWSSSYRGWWGRSAQGMSQNVVQLAGDGGGAAGAGPLAPGTLSVRANVTIVYE